VIEAEHSCMTLRGVNTPGSMLTTSKLLGLIRDDPRKVIQAFASDHSAFLTGGTGNTGETLSPTKRLTFPRLTPFLGSHRLFKAS